MPAPAYHSSASAFPARFALHLTLRNAITSQDLKNQLPPSGRSERMLIGVRVPASAPNTRVLTGLSHLRPFVFLGRHADATPNQFGDHHLKAFPQMLMSLVKPLSGVKHFLIALKADVRAGASMRNTQSRGVLDTSFVVAEGRAGRQGEVR